MILGIDLNQITACAATAHFNNLPTDNGNLMDLSIRLDTAMVGPDGHGVIQLLLSDSYGGSKRLNLSPSDLAELVKTRGYQA